MTMLDRDPGRMWSPDRHIHVGSRFIWLVAVPTGLAFSAWVVALGPVGFGPATLLVAPLLPLIGLLVVLGYRWFTRDHVRLWPYGPFALAAAVFAASMADLAIAIAREPDGAHIPLLQLGVGFLQPWLALGGGLISFIAVDARRWLASPPGT